MGPPPERVREVLDRMAEVAEEFGAFLTQYRLARPRIEVISNVTARPYGAGDPAELLTRHGTGADRPHRTGAGRPLDDGHRRVIRLR